MSHHSVNTGLSEGSFHTLRVLKDSQMQDILIIIAAMVAAGAGITTIMAGSGITVTGSGNTRTIAATGGGGPPDAAPRFSFARASRAAVRAHRRDAHRRVRGHRNRRC